MHSNWRDVDAWRNQNLPINTTSNEASKLFDVCLTQLIGLYENQQYGGFVSSLYKMVNLDPDFILGHCLKNGIELFGTNFFLNSINNQENIDNLVVKANNLSKFLTEREKLHVNAIKELKVGDLPKAIVYWEKILVEHPTDIMAIKFAYTGYYHTGKNKQMKDLLSRVMPFWNSDLPLYNYLHGLYAFSLIQNGELEKAEKYARKGLKLNRHDGWATHSLAHVYEYKSETDEGIKFLLDTEKDWIVSDLISAHNYWHLGLFYLEKNDHASVVNLFETNEFFKNPKNSLDLINSSSLLTRLKLDKFKNEDYLKSKFNCLKEKFIDKIDQHGFTYSDSHMALVFAFCGTEDEKRTFLNSLKNFINSNELNLSKYIKNVNSEISIKLYEALFYFGQDEFEKTVSLLYPLRYELKCIGGSNTQRDVFNLILIESCLKSNLDFDNKLGQALYYERLSYSPNSNLIKRIGDRYFLNEFI